MESFKKPGRDILLLFFSLFLIKKRHNERALFTVNLLILNDEVDKHTILYIFTAHKNPSAAFDILSGFTWGLRVLIEQTAGTPQTCYGAQRMKTALIKQPYPRDPARNCNISRWWCLVHRVSTQSI